MHTIVGAVLYVGCTVFALYMMVGQPDGQLWNALFWIAQLFIVINAVAKTFLQEGVLRNRYYYTIASPVQIITSKLIYNFLYITMLGILSLLAFSLFLGNHFQNATQYYLIAILGVGCLALLFTFLSAIAAQAQQGAALIAILGIPLAIPIVMILAKLSLVAIAPVLQEGWTNMLMALVGMELAMIVLSLILFPFLWNE